MQRIYLDTGVLSIFFSKNTTQKVSELMNDIKAKKIEAHILKPVLIEEFRYLCRLHGVELSKTIIISFVKEYPIKLVDLDMSLIVKAGTLKCQNPKTLSYIDCMSIAYALNEKITFHTTEKTLKGILQATMMKLRVVEYHF